MSKIVVTESGCWEYPANRMRTGYARITVGGKQVLLHRFMYQHHYGDLRDDLLVCHRWAKKRGRLAGPAWRKVPLEEVASVVRRHRSGERSAEIALDYGVSRQAIDYLLKREGAA